MNIETIFKQAFVDEWDKLAEEGPFDAAEDKKEEKKDEKKKDEGGKPSPFEKYKKKMKENGEKEEEEGTEKKASDESDINTKLNLFRSAKSE